MAEEVVPAMAVDAPIEATDEPETSIAAESEASEMQIEESEVVAEAAPVQIAAVGEPEDVVEPEVWSVPAEGESEWAAPVEAEGEWSAPLEGESDGSAPMEPEAVIDEIANAREQASLGNPAIVQL